MVDDKGYTSKTIDPAEIDTIVVPAKDDGFEETFIGENWANQTRSKKPD